MDPDLSETSWGASAICSKGRVIMSYLNHGAHLAQIPSTPPRGACWNLWCFLRFFVRSHLQHHLGALAFCCFGQRGLQWAPMG